MTEIVTMLYFADAGGEVSTFTFTDRNLAKEFAKIMRDVGVQMLGHVERDVTRSLPTSDLIKRMKEPVFVG